MNINQQMAAQGAQPAQDPAAEAQTPQQAAAPQQQPAGQPQGDQSQPTPEEADAYERVVLAGIKMITTEPMHKQLLEMVGSEENGNAPRRLAKAAVTVINAIDEQSKGTLPESVIPPASAEILENIAEFAKASGKLDVDEKTLGRAGQYLVAELAEVYGASEEDLMEFAQGLSEKEIAGAVQQQNSYDPNAGQQQQPQAAAAPQQMPGIVNKTIGA